MLIRQNEQDVASELEALVGDVHTQGWETNPTKIQRCNFCEVYKGSVIRVILGQPLQSKIQSAVSCISYDKEVGLFEY